MHFNQNGALHPNILSIYLFSFLTLTTSNCYPKQKSQTANIMGLDMLIMFGRWMHWSAIFCWTCCTLLTEQALGNICGEICLIQDFFDSLCFFVSDVDLFSEVVSVTGRFEQELHFWNISSG